MNYEKQAWAAGLACCLLAGCTLDMYDQPRIDPLEGSRFFDDGLSARPQPQGTVGRDQEFVDDPFYTGQQDGQFVREIPLPPSGLLEIDRLNVQRGRERFNIYCAPCHGRTGDGDGMVVQRGFPRPPSLHDERLRDKTPDGQIFDVIRNGFRKMPALGPRVPADDRWRIVAYVRALQLSQHLPLDQAPAELRQKFAEEGD